MNIIKNYLLWPVLGVTLWPAIYLSLVLCTFKALSFLPVSKEEILWQFISSDFVYDNSHQNLQKKLEDLVSKLPSEIHPERYNHIEILVIKNKQINAFSAPGGRIILTSGLLEAIDSEQILLFVIGHEIAHLKRRDHLREFSRMTIAKLYANITSLNLIEELLLFIDNGKQKEVEFMADKYSLKVVDSIYGNSTAAEEFFNILLQRKDAPISTTHPALGERLERIKLVHEN